MSDILWNDTFVNASWDLADYSDSNASPQSKIITVFGSLACVWIILSNSCLTASVIARGNITQEPYRIILLHMSCLDFTLGTIIVPLMVHYVHVGIWNLGPVMCYFWMGFDHFLLVLILVTWLVINIDRLLFTFKPRQYRRVVKWWVTVLMVWIPWTMVSVIAGPLYYMSIVKTDQYIPLSECYHYWAIPYYTIFLVVTFFVPLGLSVIAFAINVVVLAIWKRSHSRETANPRSWCDDDIRLNNNDNEIKLASESIVALALINCSFILMCLPFFAVNVALNISSSFDVENWVINLLYWIVYCNSAVRPLLWFIQKDIRQGFRQLFRCGRRPISQDQCTQTSRREKEVRFINFDCTRLESAAV